MENYYTLLNQFAIFQFILERFMLSQALRFKFSLALKTPLPISLLKSVEGQMSIKESLAARFRSEQLLADALKSYETYRTQLFQYEAGAKNINEQNNLLKNLFKDKSNSPNKEEKIKQMKLGLTHIKAAHAQKENQIKISKESTEKAISKIGNIVDKEVFISKDQTHNPVIKMYGKDSLNKLNKIAKSYQQLNEEFKISDLKRGQKVSGHRGYFLTGNGVKLALGLAHYGLTFLEKKGYKIYQTPALILEQVLRQNCQLQTVDTDIYKIEGEGTMLIATSEQSLAGYYRNQTLQEKQLPLSMGGYSSCFRKEAGAHGKDIHGLFRVHQFQKVEQFVICKESESQQEMQRMLSVSEQFYQSLGIPYRVVDIVSGELNDTAVRKYDLQGWYPSQKKYRELVSISNCTDYQSRMLQTKYRSQGQNKHPHMLNGTLVAIQRTITCLLENYYNSEQKTLEIPSPLQQYVGTDKIVSLFPESKPSQKSV